MDDSTKRAYNRTRLNKARDDLAAARSLLTLGYLRVAVNRAYYTIFHTASAALLWLGVERSRHLGVQSAVGEFLVKPGMIEPQSCLVLGVAPTGHECPVYKIAPPDESGRVRLAPFTGRCSVARR